MSKTRLTDWAALKSAHMHHADWQTRPDGDIFGTVERKRYGHVVAMKSLGCWDPCVPLAPVCVMPLDLVSVCELLTACQREPPDNIGLSILRIGIRYRQVALDLFCRQGLNIT